MTLGLNDVPRTQQLRAQGPKLGLVWSFLKKAGYLAGDSLVKDPGPGAGPVIPSPASRVLALFSVSAAFY